MWKSNNPHGELIECQKNLALNATYFRLSLSTVSPLAFQISSLHFRNQPGSWGLEGFSRRAHPRGNQPERGVTTAQRLPPTPTFLLSPHPPSSWAYHRYPVTGPASPLAAKTTYKEFTCHIRNICGNPPCVHSASHSTNTCGTSPGSAMPAARRRHWQHAPL